MHSAAISRPHSPTFVVAINKIDSMRVPVQIAGSPSGKQVQHSLSWCRAGNYIHSYPADVTLGRTDLLTQLQIYLISMESSSHGPLLMSKAAIFLSSLQCVITNCPKMSPQNCVCLKDYIWPLVPMCLAKVLKRIKLIKKGAWALSTKTLAQSKRGFKSPPKG